jgi:hypothetical protein
VRRAPFEQECRRAGVASFRAEIVIDEAVDAVVRLGRCSDLVVVGQTDVGAPIQGVAFDFPQQVLLHAGPPVLVVPYAGTFGSLGERVLVGWKDTREAARALRDALPLLRDARHVSLVEVGPVPGDARGKDSLEAASAWLDSHSIPVAAHREIELAGVGDQLLSRAADLDADHRRLRRLRPFAAARMGARRRHPPPARTHDGAHAALALRQGWTSCRPVALPALLVASPVRAIARPCCRARAASPGVDVQNERGGSPLGYDLCSASSAGPRPSGDGSVIRIRLNSGRNASSPSRCVSGSRLCMKAASSSVQSAAVSTRSASGKISASSVRM